MKSKSLVVLFLLTLLCAGKTFAQNEKTFSYGILLDNTGSLRFYLNNIKATAGELLSRINSQDSVSVFNFETDPSPVARAARVIMGVGATTDKNAVESYVGTVYTVAGQTALYDAVLSAAEKINSSAPSTEKVLFLITDGEDRSSKIKQEDLIAFLQQNRIKVYAIGFTQQLTAESGFIRGKRHKD